ncbi:MAG: T9SS type A sorting domain-containing protein, partial [Candidatus Cloacimonetes bacterium]|nr:T9SS type A sorting domain-containing protein [Candidatus Cloacimonadota bacterium]
LAGYYLRNSQDFFDAIPHETLDLLTVVKTRNWVGCNLSYYNHNSKNQKSTWISTHGTNGNNAFSYGEAVELVTPYTGTVNAGDLTFEWQDSGQYVTPIIEEMPTCFDYEEQAGYYPIIIEMDLDEYEEGDKPIEIAVFIDNECKGAEVIKSDDIILKAYIVDDPDSLAQELTFQLAYSYKSNKHITEYAVMDKDEKRFVTKKLSYDGKTPYSIVSFRKDDIEEGAIPLQTALKSNYPNPFNPTTTINYNIAKETRVDLSIYNIKGQKVKTLINDKIKPGYHSVVWDGTDKNNRQVSSGVYFYKLKTKKETFTRKMMMLK